MLDIAPERVPLPEADLAVPLDVPDSSFCGPF
jgi:hypothetical protein